MEILQREYVLSFLFPGDLLLYKSVGLLGRAIQLKTSSKVTHCEIYIGSGRTISSREGQGVDTYDFRMRNLAMVLRPLQAPDMTQMLKWHVHKAKGQGYDWVGLFMGFVARKWGRENDKMFCSEHTTRAYRESGVAPFRDMVDADGIHPGDFFKSAAFKCRWINPAFAKDLNHGQVENRLDGATGPRTHCAEAVSHAAGQPGGREERPANSAV